MKKLILGIILILTGFATAEAGEPLNTVKNGLNKISEMVEKDKSAKTINSELDNIIDFSYMAETVANDLCDDLNPAQCGEFKRVFGKVLQRSVYKQISNYSGKNITFLGDEIQGSKATVKSQIPYKNSQISINYKMHKNNGKWLIINYIVNDINTMDNYKRQFKRLFKKSNYSSIIQQLKNKLETYN